MRTRLHTTAAAILLALALAPLNAQEATPVPGAPAVPTGPHDVSPPVPVVPTLPHVVPPPVRPLPVVPGVPPTHVAPKTEKRTLVVAELRDIRFNVHGSISFSDPSTGETYSWSAPSGNENGGEYAPAPKVTAAAAVLAELRRAGKVGLVVFTPRVESSKEFTIQGMTLVYDTLK